MIQRFERPIEIIMVVKIQSWQQFFLAQGLFFFGLSIGILGETWHKKTNIVSWVLLGVGLGSLALSGLLWALQTQRKLRKRVRHSTLPQPMSVSQNFKNIIRGEGSTELMRGYNFSTSCRVLISSREKYTVELDSEWIIHHYEGAQIKLSLGENSAIMGQGEILRIPVFHEDRTLIVEENEDIEGLQERAPQLIFHKVACRNHV